MSRVYFILDDSGEHRAGEADLPLCVGGPPADVVLPDAAPESIVAHIARADGHAYIQPVEGPVSLFHNHERLRESHWLKSGDRIQIGDTLIDWTVKGDQVFIHARHSNLAEQLTPPPDPPPLSSARKAQHEFVAPPPSSGHPRRLVRVVAGLFSVLVLIAAFVLLATPVSVRITPEPRTQSLSGFPPAVPLGSRLLALPGSYTVHAVREGYRPLAESVHIPMGGYRELSFELQELPGRIAIEVDPDVPITLMVDDLAVPINPDGSADIARGKHRLRVQTERYLPATQTLDVAGLGKAQQVSFRLQPAWADIGINSQPPGAQVKVDDRPVGVTPLTTEILHGQHQITLSLEKHKPVILQQSVVAGTARQLETVTLPPADGRLALRTEPPAVTVSVDGEFQGVTPLTLTLSPGREHTLQLSKPGYRLTREVVTLAALETQTRHIILPPEYGVVFLTSRPADASLSIDGKPAGKATRRLRLTTRPHTLEIGKPGFVMQRVTVTPRAGVSRNLDITLKTVSRAKAEATPSYIETAAGQRLQLVRPAGEFTMGASRREAGRRANESQRRVRLTRTFYLGEKEVSNAEFRRFRSAHSSGSADGAGLNGDDQPVVNVSWDDAARYCNWLSKQENLPAAYREQGGHMLAVMPPTRGYRLPSEAEWVFVARVLGRENPARYPWAGSYPPTRLAGNYADTRIADTLADVVPGYDDQYRGSAPVGSFPARPQGFYDLGGNVAEWIHDFYAVYPGEAQRLVLDPLGPASGEHHVVRDSSWRRGSITELRLSYRDYSRAPRNDLGFRIARFAP